MSCGSRLAWSLEPRSRSYGSKGVARPEEYNDFLQHLEAQGLIEIREEGLEHSISLGSRRS